MEDMKSFWMVCPLCGGRLIQYGEAAASDWEGDYEGDDEALVSYLVCRRCGRDFEITDPTKEAREGEYREFWCDE